MSPGGPPGHGDVAPAVPTVTVAARPPRCQAWGTPVSAHSSGESSGCTCRCRESAAVTEAPPDCATRSPPSRPPISAPARLGVSKVVTVDVQGNGQRWLKVRDLTRGVTYFFRVQARTVSYGPELQANVTAGPAEGKWPRGQTGRRPRRVGPSPASPFRDRPHSGNRAGRRGAGMDVGPSGSTASRRPASRGPRGAVRPAARTRGCQGWRVLVCFLEEKEIRRNNWI